MMKDHNPLIRFDFVEPSYLLATGTVLLGIFVSLGSNLGLQAPALVIGLVWALHLLVGLTAIRVGVVSLSRWRQTATWPDFLLLAMAGLGASLALAPTSFLIDQGLSIGGIDTDDELVLATGGWLTGIPAAIFEEWTHAAGPTLLVTLLLGLPAWWARKTAAANPVGPLPEPPEPAAAKAEDRPPPAEMVVQPNTPPETAQVIGQTTPGRSCLQRLPPTLGTDLIAVRSELQYVRVYTTLGSALVLGSLKDVAEQQGTGGQLVHRTWWVSNRHVRMLRRRGTGYVLTLANGLEVPVSRRRQPAAIKQFGSSTTLD